MSYGTTDAGGEDRMYQLRSQVDMVREVMIQNINKVVERGEKLEDLVARAEYLEQNSHTFERTATRLKRKLWWQNVKLWLMLICIIVAIVTVILAIIAVIVATKELSGMNEEADTTEANNTLVQEFMNDQIISYSTPS